MVILYKTQTFVIILRRVLLARKTTDVITRKRENLDLISFFKKRFYLFYFRQRGREGEIEGEKHQCMVASHVPPTGDLACNQGMCPDWELNQQHFGLQAGTQSTEPHQPEHIIKI